MWHVSALLRRRRLGGGAAACDLPSDAAAACGLRQICGGGCGLQGLTRWAGSAHLCGGVRRPRATPLKTDRSKTAAAAAVDVRQARPGSGLLRRRRSRQPVATGKPSDSFLQAASQPARTILPVSSAHSGATWIHQAVAVSVEISSGTTLVCIGLCCLRRVCVYHLSRFRPLRAATEVTCASPHLQICPGVPIRRLALSVAVSLRRLRVL